MAVNLQVGGAVRADAWYGVRRADRELPALLRSGGMGIVLAPRQMGKSSLRLRTAARLAGEARVAQVDLAGLGTEGVDPGQWFGSLAAEIAAELGEPEPALEGAPARGWLSFVGDLLDESLVLFLDEIDVLRRLSFAEDVLGAVRAAHERAAIDPRWARLGVCLLGAATPEALGLPLNVGRRVALRDFVPGELAGLQELLPPDTVDEIYDWTAGHPYMTLRVGAAAAEDSVDALVERFFLAASAGDTNLAASEREVSIADGGEVERVETYRRALQAPIPVTEVRPAVRDALVLSGLVAVREGRLWPRNRIVATVFDVAWTERVLGERSIQAAVRRWTNAGRSEEELPRGGELAALREWAERRGDLSPDEHALLRRAAEVEAEQGARRNAMALARTRGWMVAAVSTVGVALALTAAALVRERDEARVQALRATELRLAAEAVSIAGTPRLGEQALAKALAAADLDPAPDRPEITRAVAEALAQMSGRRLRGHGAPVVGVGCGPDGTIVSVDRDGVVLSWRDGRPTPGGEAPGNAVPPLAEAEGPDERGEERLRRLEGPGGAELRWEGDLAVLRVPDGTTRPLPGHTAAGLRWAAFTELGLLTLGHDDTLRRWDARTGEALSAFLLHEGEPLAVAVCGLRVVTGASDGTVGVWELAGGAGRAVAVTDGYAGDAFADDAVLTVDRDRRPHWVDPETGSAVTGGPAWHPWEVHPSGLDSLDGDVPAIVGPTGARPLAGPLRRADRAAVHPGLRSPGARRRRRRRGPVVPRHGRAGAGPQHARRGSGLGAGREARDRVARQHGAAVGRHHPGRPAHRAREPRPGGRLVPRRRAPRLGRGRPYGAPVDRRRGRARRVPRPRRHRPQRGVLAGRAADRLGERRRGGDRVAGERRGAAEGGAPRAVTRCRHGGGVVIWRVLLDPAWACSFGCPSTFAPGGLVQPSDLADDVPVDARIVVSSSSAPRLLDADDVEVEVDVQPIPASDGLGFRLVPTADLAPRATWSVVVDEDGRDVPTVLGWFTTGEGRVGDKVAVPGDLSAVGSVETTLVRGRDSCSGVLDHVLLDTTWTRTTGPYEVEVVREGGAELVLAAGSEQLELGWSKCGETVPDLEPREQVEIRVRSVDLLGRPGEWSDPLVTSAREAEHGCATTDPVGSGVAGVLVAAGMLRRRRDAR